MSLTHNTTNSLSNHAPKNFFQFRLQHLFLSMLLGCLGFAWWSNYRSIQREKEAIQWFEQKGHVCLRGVDKTLLKPVFLGQWESAPKETYQQDVREGLSLDPPAWQVALQLSPPIPIYNVDISEFEATDADMFQLARLPSVRRLDINVGELSDQGLQWLARLKHLTHLTLYDNEQTTDTGFKPLSKLQHLRVVNLQGGTFTDAKLRHLSNASELIELYLSYTKIDGQGFDSLAKSNKLELLDLGYTLLTDDNIRFLSHFPRLKKLNLEHAPISDKGLNHLSKLNQLETLDLSGTNISDQALESLTALKSLRTLHLLSTPVTTEAIDRMRQSQPSLKIAHSHRRQVISETSTP